MNLVRIEETFRTLKSDLSLRPVYHQLDLVLPAQPPPEIRAPADPPEPVVET